LDLSCKGTESSVILLDEPASINAFVWTASTVFLPRECHVWKAENETEAKDNRRRNV